MKSNSELELRILTGLHAGARERLGVASAVLGAAPDADFILRDPGIQPRQARLEPGDEGWQLRVWDKASAEAPAPRAMRPGAIQSIGPVLIALDAPDAPWPSPEQLQAAREAKPDSDLSAGSAAPDTENAADQPVGQDTTTGEAGNESAEVPAAADASAAGQDDAIDPAATAGDSEAGAAVSLPQRLAATLAALSRASLLSPRRVAYGIAAAGVLIAWGIGWVVFGPGPANTAGTAAQVQAGAKAGAAVAPTPPDGTQALSAAIESLKLAQPVTLSVDAAGRPIVTAGLVNNEDHERLALALSRFNPRPAIRVTLEQDLIAAVRDAVGRQATEAGVALKTEHLGAGKFRVSGHLKTPAERDALLTGLTASLPKLAVLDPALTVPEDLARRLLNELSATDVAEITGQWKNDKLQIDAYLTKANLPRWEQLIGATARRYSVPFTATLHFEQPAEAQRSKDRQDTKTARATPQPAIKLPFRMMSVVSGTTPYVVLDGGAKLMLQGSRDGWRLTAIDPTSVVFEDSTARKVVLPR